MKLFNVVIFLFLTLSTNIWAGTKDYFEFKWLDPEKKVFVLQDKLHENEKKVYFNVGLGTQALSDFQDSTAYHFALGYYFAEEWGVEAFAHIYNNKDNDSYDAVQNGPSGQVLPFILRVENAYGFLLLYSPFYAKLNTYNLIYYIDWSFGLGASQLGTEDNYSDFAASRTEPTLGYESANKTAITAKTQISFHLSQMFQLNIDFYNYWVKTRQPNGGDEKYIRFHDWIFSLGMAF